MVEEPIKIWPFYDAPEEYRSLSTHGGDEDWLALLPPFYKDQYIPWMEEGSSFGCCEVSEHTLPNGYIVKIGAHA